MSKIEIEMDLNDQAFALMYARRLAELSPQLSITINDEKEMISEEEGKALAECVADDFKDASFPRTKKNVVITDNDDFPNKKGRIIVVLSSDVSKQRDERFEDAQGRKVFYRYSSVREVLKYIIAGYEKMTGQFIGTNDERMQIFGFYSQWGGCGTTAVATTFAKHLSISKEGRVLLLSTSCDCLLYSNYISKPCKPSLQLEYSIRQGRPFSPEDYVYEDEFGLNIIVFGGSEELMMSEIVKTGKFQYAVVDYGKVNPGLLNQNDGFALCQKVFCVQKENDMRGGLSTVPQEHVIIKNFSKITQNDIEFFSAPVDASGFNYCDGRIKIELFGGFGAAIKKIVGDVTGEKTVS